MTQSKIMQAGFTKTGYWQNFIQYLSSGTHSNKIKQYGLSLSKANDYNWYRDRVKKKIIGTDKNGKIVDIWVLPRRHWSCDAHWRNYDSRCFNGRRWTGKIGDVSINAQAQVGIWEENAPISIPQMMVAYDRSGNTVIVHKDRQNPDERSGKYNYGLGHAMTQHMEIVLRNTENAKCWNMALNMYRPGQFLELCQFP